MTPPSVPETARCGCRIQVAVPPGTLFEAVRRGDTKFETRGPLMVDARFNQIVYCPLHAAASEMLAALKADYAALPCLAAPSYELIHQRAALIERAEGKASDSKSTERPEDTREK